MALEVEVELLPRKLEKKEIKGTSLHWARMRVRMMVKEFTIKGDPNNIYLIK